MKDINKERMKRGDMMFLGCPCGSEEGWGVVVAHGGDAPVITGVVCLGCAEEKGVVYGKVEQ